MDLRRHYPTYVVVVLMLVSALSYLDRQVMSILISPIQADLGFTDSQMGLIIGPAFMSLFLIAGLPMGHLADRHHRGRLLAAGIAIWSAGTVMTALVSGFWPMALSRAVVGLGEAAVVPAAYSLVADYFAPDRRARAVAWVTIGIPIGAGSALFVGGLLLKLFETPQALPVLGEVQPWSLVLITFGIAGIIVAALALTIREPARHVAAATGSGGAVPGFTAFLRREPVGVTLVLLPYILLTFMQVAMIVWVPTLLTRRQGLDPADAATLYGAMTLVIPIAATLTGGWIADRLMRRHAAGPFLLVTWLAPLFLPGVLLFALPLSLPLVVTGLTITLAVGGFCTTTVYAAVQAIVPPMFRGRILALYGLTAQLAGVGFGPLIVGLVSDYMFPDRSYLHLAIIAVIVPAWIVTVICGLLGRRHFGELRAKAEPEAA
ncbi:MFS transporter [Sphingosinithalassobacter portus]|uniref:MFS transporter n=1 Tax=Stakelama portus TaxID=2676234 RepID=UPI00137A28FF|nr:MFS transporter [Sphingosinithalassobacter portus]